MADVPAWLLPHTVTVRPYTGAGAYGPAYGAPYTVPCLLRWKRRMVRTAEGREVVSEATITAAPGASLPVGSLIYQGDQLAAWQDAAPIGTVLTDAEVDDGNLGGWQHHKSTI